MEDVFFLLRPNLFGAFFYCRRFMLHLLAVDTTDVVVSVSVVAIVVIFLIAFAIGSKKAVFSTKKITAIALAIALTTTLSFLKFSLPFGGSITVFSLVPVIIVSYYYGIYYGLFTGFITGLLQFITSPYILTPLTFMLDYIFPFSAICFAGIYRKVVKNATLSVSLGTVTFYLVRYVMHFLSGIIYFNAGWITEGFPASNAVIYSLCYNAVYVFPDMLIALLFLIPFSTRKVFRENLLLS